jgi:hypothetical protein
MLDPSDEGGGKFPPYHEDFLHVIVGVSWQPGAVPPEPEGETLAVEFFQDDL